MCESIAASALLDESATKLDELMNDARFLREDIATKMHRRSTKNDAKDNSTDIGNAVSHAASLNEKNESNTVARHAQEINSEPASLIALLLLNYLTASMTTAVSKSKYEVLLSSSYQRIYTSMFY